MNRSGEEPAAAPRLQLLRTLSAQEREARARAEADARAAEAAAADAGARLAAVRAEAEAIRIVRLERPVRASVAAKSVRVREGAAKDSAAVGRLPKGEEVELLELQRTPSGSVRARTADGWVTASTGAKGKRLLDADEDLGALLRRAELSAAELSAGEPGARLPAASQPEPEPQPEPGPQPEPEWEPEGGRADPAA